MIGGGATKEWEHLRLVAAAFGDDRDEDAHLLNALGHAAKRIDGVGGWVDRESGGVHYWALATGNTVAAGTDEAAVNDGGRDGNTGSACRCSGGFGGAAARPKGVHDTAQDNDREHDENQYQFTPAASGFRNGR
jgi:hypothetical protein